jgi:hypothetical protein
MAFQPRDFSHNRGDKQDTPTRGEVMQGRKADHSPPSRVEAKNEWNCTSDSICLLCIRSNDSGNFALIVFATALHTS